MNYLKGKHALLFKEQRLLIGSDIDNICRGVKSLIFSIKIAHIYSFI